MVCPFCGCRIKWYRAYFNQLEQHDVKTFCRHCDMPVTITKEDGERERQLKQMARRARDREEGLCNMCGWRKAKDGCNTCQTCLDAVKARKNGDLTAADSESAKKHGIPLKLYKYRRYWGLCIMCGEPAEKSGKVCRKCREKFARKEKKENDRV